ncbi:hypothetical protein HK104_000589 [Borealophlyctis nickersoniae]|nr:hypothetical protein HK104_000589 [Borealophlyctis nickersoniae]
MSSAYGNIQRKQPAEPLPLPMHLPLKGGSSATLDRVNASDTRLLEDLRFLLNAEIESGNSYPQEHILDETAFANYFLSDDAFVLRRRDDNVVMGTFYVKPNFPGRCSHICNGGFIVAKAFRGLGVGKALAKAFLVLAPKLGYSASMFNLVFETNVASVSLWRSMGFQEIGRIPKAGRLRCDPDTAEEQFVDAIIFYYDFTTLPVN